MEEGSSAKTKSAAEITFRLQGETSDTRPPIETGSSSLGFEEQLLLLRERIFLFSIIKIKIAKSIQRRGEEDRS